MSIKLFVATVPGTECDDFVNELCDRLDPWYSHQEKLMPYEMDANYYEIYFGQSMRYAEAIEKRIKEGPTGLIRFMSDAMKSVYGLYRTKICSNGESLEDFIEEAF